MGTLSSCPYTLPGAPASNLWVSEGVPLTRLGVERAGDPMSIREVKPNLRDLPPALPD